MTSEVDAKEVAMTVQANADEAAKADMKANMPASKGPAGDPEKKDQRKIGLPGPQPLDANGKQPFMDNHIKTSKYEWYNFLAINTVEQFMQVANGYFLVQCVLVCFPQISPFNWYTMIGPFVFILTLAMANDAFSDMKRHAADNETNLERKADVLAPGGTGFEKKMWKDIKVGDIVEVPQDGQVPADMVLLSSQTQPETAGDMRASGGESEVNLNDSGICYVDTAELDGETNLKIYQAYPETSTRRTAESLHKLNAKLEVEQPNGFLYKFDGTLTLDGSDKKIMLTATQVVLRGMTIRNTKKVWGVVIFTGHESKIMKNNEREVQIKMSDVDHTLNHQLCIIFVMLIVMCVISAIGAGVWHEHYYDTAWYIGLKDGEGALDTNWYGTNKAALVGLLAFFTFILLFANLVPISLYVTVNLVKTLTGTLIDVDQHMFDDEKLMYGKCRNNKIIEEVGQVAYVLSDKTGTLTRNKMELLKASIHNQETGGTSYGKGVTEIEISEARLNQPATMSPEMVDKLISDMEEEGKKPDNELTKNDDPDFSFYDDRVNGNAWLKQPTPQKDDIENFIRALALCHTVNPERIKDANGKETDEIKYNAASPDDGALVKACKNFGYKFTERKKMSGNIDRLTLEVVSGPNGEVKEQHWKVLETIDFTSKRKRMSVTVESPDGVIYLIMKGADNFIRARLEEPALVNAPEDHPVNKTQKQVDDFAGQGLRTLFVAQKVVDRAFFDQWKVKYDKSLEEKNKEEQINLEEEIESGLQLVGGTAIEDKLQYNVGTTLTQLRKAGINTWVLTGDKVDTAQKIGFAASLINKEMYELVLTELGEDGHTQSARELLDSMKKQKAEAVLKAREEHEKAKVEGAFDERQVKLYLLVEGGALLSLGFGVDDKTWAKKSPAEQEELESAQREFILSGEACCAVLCCRVSPAQKGKLTAAVKKYLGKITIGIGDGANDVGMILEAHIGVGVQGVEGSQAVNNADFAICQFQHLANLVLVHGRWTYYRVAKAVCYFFYKNIVNVFTIVWYAVITGFSGTLQYNDMVLCMYNLFFTSIPVIAYALLEQDVDYEHGLKYPKMYAPGQLSQLLNTKVFFLWVGEAFYASGVIFVFTFWSRAKTEDGHDVPLAMFGLVMYFVNVLVVTLRLAIMTQFWTWIHFLTYLGSIFLWVLFCVVEFAIPKGIVTGGTMYWDSFNIAAQSWPWLSLILSTWSAVLPAFAYKCYCDCFQPDINELWKQAGAAEEELELLEAEETRKKRENASPAELERQAALAKGNTSMGDAGVNAAHAMQGRAHVLKAEMGTTLATVKALNKFKGMSNKFKPKPK